MEWDIVSALSGVVRTVHDESVVNAALKLFIAISQQYVIDFPKDIIQKIKNLEGKVAQELVKAIASGPDIEATKKWPLIDMKEAELLLKANSDTAASNSRSKPALPERSTAKPVSVLRRDAAPVDLSSVEVKDVPIQFNPCQAESREFIRRGLKATLRRPISTLGDSVNNSSMETPLRRAKFRTDYNAQNPKLPLLKETHKIDTDQYSGQEEKLFAHFMEQSLTDKDTSESKMVRNMLGLGMIEATGVKKATGCGTLKELVEWYVASSEWSKVFSTVLYGVISVKKAEKLVALMHLIATKKLHYEINNPNIFP
eukprot:TRINITY_DN9119_c0_g1_i8.p1 TRINITY_DN9119_c0_g1~~TRINITY_DN9119_c0_g1_i8.p1  ORF type:complete len:313 (+),score=58.56 TRINITY_DN9119_c0_g1_i8:544-1482(+)